MSMNEAAPAPLRPRRIPPRIDAAAASELPLEPRETVLTYSDLSYLPRGPSTPSSITGNGGHAQDQLIIPRGPSTPSSMQSNARSASPSTVSSGRKSPYRMPPRSATAPVFPRSPSPDVPLPQECAFPVFPTPQSQSTTLTTPRRTPIERAKTDPPQLEAQHQLQQQGFEASNSPIKDWGIHASQNPRSVQRTAYAAPESWRSYSRPASPALSQIAVGRPSTSGSDSRRKFSSSSARPSIDSIAPVEPIPALPQPYETSTHQRTFSFTSLHLNPEVDDSIEPETAVLSPSEVERPLQLPPSLRAGGPSRPQTPQESAKPSGSEPGLTSSRPMQSHLRKPSVSAAHRPLDEIGSLRLHRPTLSRSVSPSKPESDNMDNHFQTSVNVHRTDMRLIDAPPVPETTHTSSGPKYISQAPTLLAAEHREPLIKPISPQQALFETVEIGAETNHTPTQSTSSRESNDTFAETSSSRSSPPLSSLSSSPEKEFAVLERTLQSMGAPVVPPPPAIPPSTQARRRGPARSFSRPTYAVNGPAAPSPPVQVPEESKPPSQPESPMDPALKGGRLPPLIIDDKNFPPVSTRQPMYPQSAVTPNYRGPNNFPDLAPPPLNLQKTPARRATTSHKGRCRGCSEFITGKSVSSADGRLTGRWHKQCFVCKTCKEPFPTMDFYVLGNDPYCNRHYHQLNKTLCSNCDRGIEGQYIETEQQKFHPHCFNCCVSLSCRTMFKNIANGNLGMPPHPP